MSAEDTSSKPRALFPGALEMMILEIIRRQPVHGYAVVQLIHQRSDELLQVEEGSVYPALQRLLKGGLVDAQWETSASGRRVRTYSITPRGEQHLEREVESLGQMLNGMRRVLAPES